MEAKIRSKPPKTAGHRISISLSAYLILLQTKLLPNMIVNMDVFGTILVDLTICLSTSLFVLTIIQ